MTDMTRDTLGEQTFGQLALAKLAPVPENFRLFQCEWMGDKPEEWTVMQVKGAEFRIAKSGPNKGKLSILVPGTERTAFVTADEIRAATPD